MSFARLGRFVASVLAVCVLASVGQATTVADSVADFAPVQGHNGWYYGYDAGGGFTPMPVFSDSGGDAYWSSGVTLGYPYIRSFSQIPCTADYTGFNAWAVRRWVSDIDAEIEVSGVMQRAYWEPYNVGDGVLEGVALNESYRTLGTFLAAQHLAPWDYTEYRYNVSLRVHPGDTLDFITGPYGTTWGDNAIFTATITQVVPEPLTLAALGLGFAGLCRYACRRRVDKGMGKGELQ